MRFPSVPHVVLLVLCVGACHSQLRAAEERIDGDPNPPVPQPTEGDTDPPQTPALSCYEQAKNIPGLEDYEALMLCHGSLNTAPVECYQEGRQIAGLKDFDVFTLCRCTTSTAPLGCYRQARQDTFLDPVEILDLCNPVNLGVAIPNCVPQMMYPPVFPSP